MKHGEARVSSHSGRNDSSTRLFEKIIEQGGSETTHISNQSNRENGNGVGYFSFPVNNLT